MITSSVRKSLSISCCRHPLCLSTTDNKDMTSVLNHGLEIRISKGYLVPTHVHCVMIAKLHSCPINRCNWWDCCRSGGNIHCDHCEHCDYCDCDSQEEAQKGTFTSIITRLSITCWHVYMYKDFQVGCDRCPSDMYIN